MCEKFLKNFLKLSQKLREILLKIEHNSSKVGYILITRGQKGCLPQSVPPFVPTQAHCGDPGQGGAVSVGPIWHACIAIRPAKHRYWSRNRRKQLLFCVTFFLFCAPFFRFSHFAAFHTRVSIRAKNQKILWFISFIFFFFAALIKNEIRIIYKKCVVSVSYFVVCFTKYPRNTKYKKCIAGRRITWNFL